MIRDIPEPEVSAYFTIEDLHRIREWNYESLKDATMEERRIDTAHRCKAALKKLGIEKNVKTVNHAQIKNER